MFCFFIETCPCVLLQMHISALEVEMSVSLECEYIVNVYHMHFAQMYSHLLLHSISTEVSYQAIVIYYTSTHTDHVMCV